MSFLSKLATIVKWTFFGASAAWVSISVWLFARLSLASLVGGSGPFPDWFVNLLLGGAGLGFLVGLLVASNTVLLIRDRS